MKTSMTLRTSSIARTRSTSSRTGGDSRLRSAVAIRIYMEVRRMFKKEINRLEAEIHRLKLAEVEYYLATGDDSEL